MTAITGIYYREGSLVKYDQIRQMNDRLSHRGLDGSKVYCEDSLGLGHQMLYTTPESIHETLPFEEDGLTITSDARIDNRKELSEKLNIEDDEEVSDSYFILKAYHKWGEKCLEKLLGDFVFVIWDRKYEKLFCARDHMGVKPFYYYLSNDVFIFASEIKALFSIPNVPHKLNELHLSNHLALIYTERSSTFYENIFRLPAAHSLTVTSDTKNLKSYWKLDPNNKVRLNSEIEYIKLFKDIFTKAVECRLRSAYPVGSMLSGGLDSSFTTCIAKNILKNQQNNLKTYSAIFDSVPDSNERYFIEKVLSSGEFDSHFIKTDKFGPLDEIDAYLKHADHPSIPPNTFITWNICREANKSNVRILLDGAEGDVTVSHGSGYLSELARKIKLKKLLSEVNATSHRLGINPYKTIFSIYLGIITPHFIKKSLQYSRESKGEYNTITRIIQKEFAEKTHLIKRWHKIYETDNFKSYDAHETHYMGLKSPFIQNELEILDWISAPFSVELKHPFFDKRLIEFCLAIPTEQKFANGWDRFILRQAMTDIVPVEVQWRKNKGNLKYNFDKSLIKYNNKFLEKTLSTNTHSIEKYVDIPKLNKIYNEYYNSKKVNHPNDSIHIWNAINLAVWMNKLN